MSELLFDINLQQLPDEYLAGEWRVADRVLNRTDPHSPLARADRFQLRTGHLKVAADDYEEQGQWRVQRDEVLGRPYLELEVAQEHTRALITRLRRSADGLSSQLNLYFMSGMEVQLVQA
ncbi:hypothetical protein [Hymenobacter weizhouensis]|uniref:hypothetical protein n=1 Tax=Hymenobacter sp. YIM 151500-1 TaxID=2987689 RepID=UPI0022274351|nr:hypothetical protein [Hymenobacter sp. YIM 151500-1]UYZ65106.1 hypothetical protein OIS53_09680 [Hymenobacter sp. YIM 151500-1]